jgi:hypothetical protein
LDGVVSVQGHEEIPAERVASHARVDPRHGPAVTRSGLDVVDVVVRPNQLADGDVSVSRRQDDEVARRCVPEEAAPVADEERDGCGAVPAGSGTGSIFTRFCRSGAAGGGQGGRGVRFDLQRRGVSEAGNASADREGKATCNDREPSESASDVSVDSWANDGLERP